MGDGEVLTVVLEMDTVEVAEVGDGLVRAAAAVTGGAEPLALGAPVPEDHFELGELLEDYERARAAFDLRFAEGLGEAGTKLTVTALEAIQRDQFPPLVPYPAAAGDRGGR